MQVVLMAGGPGTRLRPYTAVIPKPLVPVGELSIIEIVLRQLRFFGVERITISVGYKAELIMAVVGDGSAHGLRIDYFRETTPLGTVGSLALMDGLDDQFLVMNGDICSNMNYAELFQGHLARGCAATIGTYRRKEKIELGVMEREPDGTRITAFREKPVYDFFVSMGVNAFHRSVVDLIPRGQPFGFDDLMHAMLDRGLEVHSHLFSGTWLDIGRPDDYDRMIEIYERDPGTFLPPGA